MRIRRKFLQLTKFTYPHGTEKQLEKNLPNGVEKDDFGNYYLVIGEKPTTMFTCHLDTACKKQEKVYHRQNSQYIYTNGKTILGADDKAGMVVLLYMINNSVPGLYYFFIGEEVGCIGSGKVAGKWDKNKFSKTITKVVSFDRRGTDSIITHQYFGRSCSDDFANELSKRLNDTKLVKMKPDDTGVMTDSAKFMDDVYECTNISVGYYKEHTTNEYQDIEFLQKLCRAVILIDWETLPVKRDTLYDIDDYCYGYGRYKGNYVEKNKEDKTKEEKSKVLEVANYDEEEEIGVYQSEFTESFFTYVKDGQYVRRTLVSRTQIEKEKGILTSWIFKQEAYKNYDIKGITWNGESLYIMRNGGSEFIGTRPTLMCMVPELTTPSKSELSDKPGGKRYKTSSLRKGDNGLLSSVDNSFDTKNIKM
jgi:hypothetical protein